MWFQTQTMSQRRTLCLSQTLQLKLASDLIQWKLFGFLVQHDKCSWMSSTSLARCRNDALFLCLEMLISICLWHNLVKLNNNCISFSFWEEENWKTPYIVYVLWQSAPHLRSCNKGTPFSGKVSLPSLFKNAVSFQWNFSSVIYFNLNEKLVLVSFLSHLKTKLAVLVQRVRAGKFLPLSLLFSLFPWMLFKKISFSFS